MLNTALVRTLREAALIGVAGTVALGLHLAVGASPSESRICVGAMQTTACVPPA